MYRCDFLHCLVCRQLHHRNQQFEDVFQGRLFVFGQPLLVDVQSGVQSLSGYLGTVVLEPIDFGGQVSHIWHKHPNSNRFGHILNFDSSSKYELESARRQCAIQPFEFFRASYTQEKRLWLCLHPAFSWTAFSTLGVHSLLIVHCRQWIGMTLILYLTLMNDFSCCDCFLPVFRRDCSRPRSCPHSKYFLH